MLIWKDSKNNLVYIQIEMKSDDLCVDSLFVKMLKAKGWDFCSSSITCNRSYSSDSELISILKDIDVPSDGIEEIVSCTKQT